MRSTLARLVVWAHIYARAFNTESTSCRVVCWRILAIYESRSGTHFRRPFERTQKRYFVVICHGACFVYACAGTGRYACADTKRMLVHVVICRPLRVIAESTTTAQIQNTTHNMWTWVPDIIVRARYKSTQLSVCNYFSRASATTSSVTYICGDM